MVAKSETGCAAVLRLARQVLGLDGLRGVAAAIMAIAGGRQRIKQALFQR